MAWSFEGLCTVPLWDAHWDVLSGKIRMLKPKGVYPKHYFESILA